MRNDYNSVLKRLKEERERMAWSQKVMSQYAHMSQGNYCKIEQGLRRFSYFELKYLCKSEIDVNYIYTGQRGNDYYKERLKDCGYIRTLGIFRIVVSMIAYYYATEQSEFWGDLYHRVKYIQLIDAGQQSGGSLLLSVRRALNYQQQKMAKELGIDIKKLRSLENDQCLPDSELLWRLYDSFFILPAVILKDGKGLLCEVSCLLEKMDSAAGKGAETCNIIQRLQNRV